MARWWKQHAKAPRVCARCQRNEDVHEGLCRKCRAELLAEETPKGEIREVRVGDEQVPEAPSLEPPHARPWVHRGGG
jgi:hypothetical protein